MTHEHKQDIQQEPNLSGFLVQKREEHDLDIEEVFGRTDISVERLEEIEEDATNITLFEARELARLYGCEVTELSRILWDEQVGPILEKIKEIESEGIVLRVSPPHETLTLADNKRLLGLLESLME